MTAQNYITVTLAGTIEGDSKSGTSSNGTSYLRFYLRTKENDIYECLGFDSVAKATLSPGVAASIRGYFKDVLDKADKRVMVKVLSTVESTSRPLEVTTNSDREFRKLYLDSYQRKGLIPIYYEESGIKCWRFEELLEESLPRTYRSEDL